MRGIGVSVVLWTLILASAHAADPQAVRFVDGRSLWVAGAERQGDVAVLTLDGGGQISLPAARVANWDELGPPGRDQEPEALPRASAMWRLEAGTYAQLIEGAASRHGLDPALLTAMAQVESAFDARAVSPKGACGLLQLMPATAERFGVQDVFDAAQNVDGGARYMSWLLERFGGRTDLALAGYNAGEGAVDRHRGIPPYSETRQYVHRVLQGAGRLASLAP
jgi:soluble lytic murein transglycosylase-like protein